MIKTSGNSVRVEFLTMFATYRTVAAKWCFMYYLRVVIILFSTGLYKSAFSTYTFGKL